jgi:hypothetical protein
MKIAIVCYPTFGDLRLRGGSPVGFRYATLVLFSVNLIIKNNT